LAPQFAQVTLTDGLLGMSFLSRFEVQMAGGSIEIRTRHPRK
jgi:aspartyl protease family protein